MSRRGALSRRPHPAYVMENIMRSGLLYLVLIGIPVVALIGVIRIGERIAPPPYVGGVWRITEEAGSLPEEACRLFGAAPIDMEITQSGTVLDMDFGGAPPVRARARFRGGAVRAERLQGAPACADGWVLEARLDSPTHMTGSWSPAGCDTCPVRAFTATRITATETSER